MHKHLKTTRSTAENNFLQFVSGGIEKLNDPQIGINPAFLF
jgi:hypothetical protein